MKKIMICTMALATIVANSINLTNKKENIKISDEESFLFALIVRNDTNNVGGGNTNDFGTWFYLDIKINGTIYNDDNFKNISTENDSNAGGSNVSMGRRHDKDVFITNFNESAIILPYTKINSSSINITLTFGTIYWFPLGFFVHSELLSINNFSLKDFSTMVFEITASGSAGANSANSIYAKK